MIRKSGLLAVLLMVTGCSVGTIEPGHTGIIVNQMGDDKGGVSVMPNGFYMRAPWYSVYEYPNSRQTTRFAKDSSVAFQDHAGQVMHADVVIEWKVPPQNATTTFVTWRDEFDQIASKRIYNVIIGSFAEVGSKMTAEHIFGEGKSEFREAVLADLKKKLIPVGIEVETFTVNNIDPPEAVKATIGATTQARQLVIQKDAEVKQVQAEAAKQVAAAEGEAKVKRAQADGEAYKIRTEADAQAYANQKLTQSISPGVLELKRLEVEMAQAQQWDGKLPTQMIPGSAVPFISVK